MGCTGEGGAKALRVLGASHQRGGVSVLGAGVRAGEDGAFPTRSYGEAAETPTATYRTQTLPIHLHNRASCAAFPILPAEREGMLWYTAAGCPRAGENEGGGSLAKPQTFGGVGEG
jgi:hypothetical protein